MKVTFLLPSLAAGGAERVFVNLANELAKSGFEVCMLVSSDANAIYFEELSQDVVVEFIGSNRLYKSIPKIVEYLKLNPSTVLIATMSFSCVVAKLAILISRQKVRFIAREAISPVYDQAQLGTLKRLIYRYVVRWTYRRADWVVSTNEEMSVQLKDLYKLDSSFCLLYTSPSPRDLSTSRMPSSA